MIARLDSSGDLLVSSGDPLERDLQIARVVAAFPLVTQAPDWLAFLRAYGGLTYVRGPYSTGFFGVSSDASVHLLDGEGEPVSHGCLLICDSDPPIWSAYAAFGFPVDPLRPWGVYGVTTAGRTEWYAATFTEWFESFVEAIT